MVGVRGTVVREDTEDHQRVVDLGLERGDVGDLQRIGNLIKVVREWMPVDFDRFTMAWAA